MNTLFFKASVLKAIPVITNVAITITIPTGIVFLAVFLLMPLIVVFHEALAKGIGAYMEALISPDTRSAIRLTLPPVPSAKGRSFSVVETGSANSGALTGPTWASAVRSPLPIW